MRLTLTRPLAGINRLVSIKGGGLNVSNTHTEMQYFTSAAIYEPYKIFPWAGVSFAYTIK